MFCYQKKKKKTVIDRFLLSENNVKDSVWFGLVFAVRKRHRQVFVVRKQRHRLDFAVTKRHR